MLENQKNFERIGYQEASRPEVVAVGNYTYQTASWQWWTKRWTLSGKHMFGGMKKTFEVG